jgi:hypothetical protein
MVHMIPVSTYVHWRGECAFMRALRAQHCISSVGAQAAVLIETQNATITHWGNRHNLRETAIASAHLCAQHYISSVGAQTAGLNETPIGTNTHWGNRHKLWESACA